MRATPLAVIDTSALMALLLREPEAGACRSAIDLCDKIAISAASLAEALIVARGRGLGDHMMQLTEELRLEVVPLDRDRAIRAASAYARWGRGNDPAGLNLGDCFAYALAAEQLLERTALGHNAEKFVNN
jgi:ribonuclease VapC